MKKIIMAIVASFTMLITSPAFAYNVQPGDTAFSIARDHQLTYQQLQELNPQITDFSSLTVGQHINTEREVSSKWDKRIKIGPFVLTREEYYLAQLVRAEAVGEPYQGKVAVARVVLNRVDSHKYPYTIHEVINQTGQFTPVENGYIKRKPDAHSILATVQALNEDRSKVDKDILYFYNPVTTRSRWLDQMETAFVIGNHTFKRDVIAE